LIHGAPGVGKLALAERFAQLLLCENQAGTDPCGKCEGCRWFISGSHPDARFVEPEVLARKVVGSEEAEEGEEKKERKQPSSEIKIEQVRALAGFVNVASHRGGRRIAIIHPAEAMNINSANALLKSLEEPPAAAMFLLVSHRPAGLLPTIRSRCISIAVPMPEQNAAAAWLAAQGLKNAEHWLAFAGGAPLRALEYANGERGEATERALRSLASGDRGALADVKSRDELEPLAEVLQKMALDRAFLALTGSAKYAGGGKAGDKTDARAWLSYARALGRQRLLARHPLNPKLFAAEMVEGMPRS
jgi:DNA polymerase-3 subunit delta'